MPNVVWDAETLTRLNLNAEQHFSIDYPCILDRLSLTLVAGTADYTVPEYVHSIKRVTYKGTKLDPMPYRTQRQIFQSATQSSKPFWYIFNNIGQFKISLFPIPNENLAAGTTDLWAAADIANTFIIEYYRIADGITAFLPLYFRRRLLRAYVAKMTFAQESRGQKLKNADYFDKKYDAMSQMYAETLSELHNKPRRLFVSGGIGGGFFPGRPIYPIDRFGTGVDIGE